MPTSLTQLLDALDECLQPQRFNDYCPNGLQVEGSATVTRLACAVTANQSVLDAAIAWGADALLVHHGYFWRGEEQRVIGMKRARLASLLAGNLSLLAYHLPLDAHGELGNNAQLGRRLGIDDPAPLQPADAQGVGNIGYLPAALSAGELAQVLREITGRDVLHIGDPQASVHRIAWCTGAAQGYIDAAAAAGADAYISGEISEQTVHSAREQRIHYFAAGHHATERFGVQAVAAAMAEQLDLEWRFFDCDNPV